MWGLYTCKMRPYPIWNILWKARQQKELLPKVTKQTIDHEQEGIMGNNTIEDAHKKNKLTKKRKYINED